MTTRDLDSPPFEGGLHLRDGAVVGCWLVDRWDALRGCDPSPAALRWDVARHGRDLHVIRSRRSDGTVPVGRTSREQAKAPGERSTTRTVQQWLRTVDGARAVVGLPGLGDGARRQGFLRVPVEHRGTDGADGFVAAASRALVEALRAIDPFVASLDPRAVWLALDDAVVPADHGRVYARIDRTVDPGADVARAIDDDPAFARLLTRLATDPNSRLSAALPLGRDAVRAEVAVKLARGNGDAAAAFRIADAWRELLEDALATIVRTARVRGRDACQAFAQVTPTLPRDWEPRDAASWTAFAGCHPALEHARGRGSEGPRMIDARGDWPAYLRRLGKAHGGHPGGLATALTDLADLTTAYAAEVVAPAAALAGRRGGPHAWRETAEAMLSDGRRLCAHLDTSRRWHAGRQAILAVVAAHTGADAEEPDAWPAAWPDFEHGGVTVRELTTRGQLSEEGAQGPDADGRAGLSHCVGGYVQTCLLGETRIVGLRDADGSRLSTAELTCIDGTWAVRIAQHRGYRNADPPPRAQAALSAYLDAIAGGTLAVERAALSLVPGAARREWHVPYDHLAPGAWEAVRDAWAPYVPRRFRGLAPSDVAAIRDALPPGPRRGWSPVPVPVPVPVPRP